MKPVEPPKREGFDRVVFAKDQREYIPLPANISRDLHGSVETRWRLTWREWFKLLFGADVYLNILTFRNPLQPILLTVGEHHDNNTNAHDISAAKAEIA